MASGKLDIVIERGRRFTLRYFVKQGGATGRPLTVEEALALDAFDLTGFTGGAEIKESPDSTTVIIEPDFTVETPETDGAINIVIDEEDTATMPTGIQHWNCHITSTGTGPIGLLLGRATVVNP